jgi:hypothetical protein
MIMIISLYESSLVRVNKSRMRHCRRIYRRCTGFTEDAQATTK